MAQGCIFCRIAAGEVPATVVSEDEHTVAFRDTNPQAPTHVLVIPRRHIPSVNVLTDADAELVGRLVLAAKAVAREEGIAETGYRLVGHEHRPGSGAVGGPRPPARAGRPGAGLAAGLKRGHAGGVAGAQGEEWLKR